MSITSLTPQQLRQAADLKEKIEELQTELNKFLLGEGAIPVPIVPPVNSEEIGKGKKGRKKFSAEARAKMAAAQMARRAKERGETQPEVTPAIEAAKPKSKKFSPAARKALSLAAKKRWAKARKEGRTKL